MATLRMCLTCKGWDGGPPHLANGQKTQARRLVEKYVGGQACSCRLSCRYGCPLCGAVCVCTRAERRGMFVRLVHFLKRHTLSLGAPISHIVERACFQQPHAFALDNLVLKSDLTLYGLRTIGENSKYHHSGGISANLDGFLHSKFGFVRHLTGLVTALSFKSLLNPAYPGHYYGMTSPSMRDAQLTVLGRTMFKLMASPCFPLGSATFFCCAGPYLLMAQGKRKQNNSSTFGLAQEPVRTKWVELFPEAAAPVAARVEIRSLPTVLQEEVEEYVGYSLRVALIRARERELGFHVARVLGKKVTIEATEVPRHKQSKLMKEAFENDIYF